jgi:hypothetical protein
MESNKDRFLFEVPTSDLNISLEGDNGRDRPSQPATQLQLNSAAVDLRSMAKCSGDWGANGTIDNKIL